MIDEVVEVVVKLKKGEITPEEASSIFQSIVKKITETEKFKTLFIRLMKLDKEFLAFVLAGIFTAHPYGLELIEAFEAGDAETMRYFDKKAFEVIKGD